MITFKEKMKTLSHETRNEGWESNRSGKGHNFGQRLLRRLVKCAKNVKFPFDTIIITKLLNLEAGKKTMDCRKTQPQPSSLV